MGIRNLRAICPSCGGKIHTQAKGVGRFTWASSSALVATGSECQHCGAALSGKVGVDNKAILAADADKSFMERAKEEAGLVESAPDEMDSELAERTAEWKKGRKRRRFSLRR
jgi:hypothetical protein